MLGREVVEGQQRIAIFDQALDRLVVFDAPGLNEDIERRERIPLGLGHPDLLQRGFAFECWLFGNLFSTLVVLCTQQRWPRVCGQTSSTACQKPSAPSATANSGPIASPRRFRSSSNSLQDCALSRTPSIKPTSSFFPSGVAPIMTQETLRGLLEPGLHMDAVDPEVYVALG